MCTDRCIVVIFLNSFYFVLIFCFQYMFRLKVVVKIPYNFEGVYALFECWAN